MGEFDRELVNWKDWNEGRTHLLRSPFLCVSRGLGDRASQYVKSQVITPAKVGRKFAFVADPVCTDHIPGSLGVRRCYLPHTYGKGE